MTPRRDGWAPRRVRPTGLVLGAAFAAAVLATSIGIRVTFIGSTTASPPSSPTAAAAASAGASLDPTPATRPNPSLPSVAIVPVTEFRAAWDNVDPAEITDARWFSVDAMPIVPGRMSIARQLIDDWVLRRGGDPDSL